MYKFNEIYLYSKDLSVLYVEDDEDLLEETTEAIEDFFKLIETATNGEDGIEKYNKFFKKNNTYPDLIITDINMPKMDGITMIKKIMEINPEQSVIVISAYNDSDKLIDLIHLGISNFIMKPMNTENMTNVLYKTCKDISNQKSKNNYLIQQSKLAQMGEMIDFIAHQWIQPINVIKMSTDLLEMYNSSNKVTPERLNEYLNTQITQIDLITETLQEFRNFFKKESEPKIIKYKDLIDKTLLLLKGKLKNKVDVFNYIPDDVNTQIIVNEFKHIIINIITNALEAFEINKIQEKRLIFKLEEKDECIALNIIDNAGGIPENVIGNIFNPHFTTKETGSGVGLYLSKLIIEKAKGRILVENTGNGAKFSILLPKIKNAD